MRKFLCVVALALVLIAGNANGSPARTAKAHHILVQNMTEAMFLQSQILADANTCDKFVVIPTHL